MVNAEDVLQETRSVLRKTEDRIRSHPFIAELAAGRVSLDDFRAFPGHQYHMWKSDLRSAANLVVRFGDRGYASFFRDDLQAEIEAREGIVALAGKLGLTVEDLEDYELSAPAFAYSAYFTWLANYGSAAEAACALALNLAAWGDNCGRIGQALRDNYGCTREDTVFLDGFADLPSLEGIAKEIIEDDLGRGVLPRQIVQAARLLQTYEVMFWDAMADAAGIDAAA